MIILRSGSVFSCPSLYSLGHCISSDAKMSKGVARKFVHRYPVLCSLRENGRHNPIGTAVAVPVGPKFIYNLVTKHAFWMKPNRDKIKDCLQSMFTHAVANYVTDICVPKLGGGLDGLDFAADILPILEAVFSASEINIYVYSIDHFPRYVFANIIYLKARWRNSSG